MNEILKELDGMIEIQKQHVERLEQDGGVEVVSYNRGRLDQLQEIRDLIKEKSAHGAATPMSTLLNKQEQYNTDQKKSEIRKLVEERRGNDNDADHNGL